VLVLVQWLPQLLLLVQVEVQVEVFVLQQWEMTRAWVARLVC
jgi:hypothetical protein